MIGRALSHFKIGARLGKGGMGEVYRATDQRLARQVAIKLLPPECTESRDRLARFHREARVLASLNHGNIAAIHEIGEHDGVHFLVMELVEGETLSQRISRGPMPPRDAVELFLQIAAGLEAAHDRGIVHRDLKPDNIQITPDGTVKLLDFGLAKALGERSGMAAPEPDLAEAESTLSELGTFLGTPGYMSPEQIRGVEADQRADIWAFGCLLYEVLTGEAVFGGRTGGARIAAALAQDSRLDALPSSTPPALCRLLSRCLRKPREKRLHSIADARIELEDAIAELDRGLGREEPSRGADQPAALVRTFQLTAELCRQLDRDSLDPRVIGDYIHYLDNDRDSEVLVFYLPGMGLDHRIFEEVVSRSPYRCLATNFYGCEPAPEYRFVMALPDQLTVLRHLVTAAISDLAPKAVVLVGFSLGADAAFRLLVETDLEPQSVDGILSLSCNLSLETCVFSSRLAEVASASPDEVLPALREITQSIDTLEAWVEVNRYLAEVIWKYRSEMHVLQSLADGTLAPFKDPDNQSFATWYRYATENGIAVRLVFTDNEQELLRGVKLRHLDEGVLGPSFRDDDFHHERGKNHFQLLSPELIERHLDRLIQRIRER